MQMPKNLLCVLYKAWHFQQMLILQDLSCFTRSIAEWYKSLRRPHLDFNRSETQKEMEWKTPGVLSLSKKK